MPSQKASAIIGGPLNVTEENRVGRIQGVGFCISQHGRLAMILSLMSNVSFLLIPKTLALSPRNLFHVKAMMLSRLAESAWPGWIVSRNTTITIFFCLLLLSLLFFWPGWIISRNTTITIFFCLLLLFWPGWMYHATP